MKNIFKYIGIISLMLFSFYYANNIANYMASKTDLMKQIKLHAKKVESVDAVINEEYIIPGLNGLSVNISSSYNNMVSVGSFDEKYFVFDEINPTISLKDHLDKIIKKGNHLKREVALIIDNKELFDYCLKNHLKCNYLINKDTMLNCKDELLINNEIEYFYDVEKYLNKHNLNRDICVISKYNKKICESNGKYLIEPTYVISNSNMANTITEIDSGDIIKIDNISMTNFIILINKIRYRDLKISYLNDLISEKYSSL